MPVFSLYLTHRVTSYTILYSRISRFGWSYKLVLSKQNLKVTFLAFLGPIKLGRPNTASYLMIYHIFRLYYQHVTFQLPTGTRSTGVGHFVLYWPKLRCKIFVTTEIQTTEVFRFKKAQQTITKTFLLKLRNSKKVRLQIHVN